MTNTENLPDRGQHVKGSTKTVHLVAGISINCNGQTFAFAFCATSIRKLTAANVTDAPVTCKTCAKHLPA